MTVLLIGTFLKLVPPLGLMTFPYSSQWCLDHGSSDTSAQMAAANHNFGDTRNLACLGGGPPLQKELSSWAPRN